MLVVGRAGGHGDRDRGPRAVRDRAAWSSGEVVDASELGGRRYVEEPLRQRVDRPMSGRIAVGVSGAGSNLRARRGRGGVVASSAATIVLVVRRPACPAIDWAGEQGFETAIVPAPVLSTLPAGRLGRDAGRDAARRRRPTSSCWPGSCACSGRRSWPPSRAGSSTPTPPSLPAFPGAHAVARRARRGRRAERRHGPPRRRDARRRADRRSRRRCRSCPATTRRRAPRADPGGRASAPAASRRPAARRRRPRSSTGAVDARRRLGRVEPARSRAGRSCRSRTRPASRRSAAASSPSASSSSRPAARPRRCARPACRSPTSPRSPAFPEMLDGRVKTLHPRVHAGILADRRRADHRRQLVGGRDRPVRARRDQPLSVRGGGRAARDLVRRARRGDRHRRADAGPGGGQEPRLGRGRHLARPLPGDPRGPRASPAASRPGCGRRSRSRRSGTRPPTTPGSPRTLPGRMAAAGIELPDEPGLPGRGDPYPPTLTIALEKVETLRYGENPHQPAARYRRPGSSAAGRPVRERGGAAPGQGAQLQQRPRRLGRRGPRRRACTARPASSSSTRTRAAPRSEPSLLEAWQAALAGDPVSAFGGVVALTGPVDAAAGRGARRDLPRGDRRAGLRAGRARDPRPARRTCA